MPNADGTEWFSCLSVMTTDADGGALLRHEVTAQELLSHPLPPATTAVAAAAGSSVPLLPFRPPSHPPPDRSADAATGLAPPALLYPPQPRRPNPNAAVAAAVGFASPTPYPVQPDHIAAELRHIRQAMAALQRQQRERGQPSSNIRPKDRKVIELKLRELVKQQSIEWKAEADKQRNKDKPPVTVGHAVPSGGGAAAAAPPS